MMIIRPVWSTSSQPSSLASIKVWKTSRSNIRASDSWYLFCSRRFRSAARGSSLETRNGPSETCSLLVEENAGQIDAFLTRHVDAQADDPGSAFGHASGAGRQRLTGEDGMDGFFYARLRKAAG